jgi:hypothetical protein
MISLWGLSGLVGRRDLVDRGERVEGAGVADPGQQGGDDRQQVACIVTRAARTIIRVRVSSETWASVSSNATSST